MEEAILARLQAGADINGRPPLPRLKLPAKEPSDSAAPSHLPSEFQTPATSVASSPLGALSTSLGSLSTKPAVVAQPAAATLPSQHSVLWVVSLAPTKSFPSFFYGIIESWVRLLGTTLLLWDNSRESPKGFLGCKT